jgi:GT2 family glycosyltransferase
MKRLQAPVLIIIVSTDDGEWLGPCLHSLSESNCQDFDVLVVANDCADRTLAMCRHSPVRVKVVERATRGGFAECNNIGLRLALSERYKYAFLLNPDTKVHRDAVGMLVDFMESNEEYGVTGSLQIRYDDESWSVHNRWSSETIDEARQLSNHPRRLSRHEILEHYYVQGAAMMLRSDLVRKVGLLDPLYVTFYEETDLCRRCILSGKRVCIVLGSKVKHFEGGNWKRSREDHIRRDHLFLRNQFFFFLSAARGWESVRVFVGLLREHLRAIRRREKNLVLPMHRYPSVLLSFLSKAGYVRRLKKRNETISARKQVEASEMAIGPS